MDIAKMTSKGQVTVPKAVREKLNLDTGSKIVFLQKGDDLIIRNAEVEEANQTAQLYRLTEASLPAFRRLQEAFRGLADEEGIHTDEELTQWMKTKHEGELE